MYEVQGKSFNRFEEVVEWAWNEHKIDFEQERELTEEEKQDACKRLHDRLELMDDDSYETTLDNYLF